MFIEIKVNSAKYLGVIIDHKLNWIDHIACIKNKISKGIGIMYRARNFLNKSSLIGLYYSYIIIIIIIKYQVYIALISNKCSEALNSATQNIIYKHSILITSVITMKP